MVTANSLLYGSAKTQRRANHQGEVEPISVQIAGADLMRLDEDGLAATFPAAPSPACRWCDFVRVCPEGSAQYRPAEPWAALGEPAG